MAEVTEIAPDVYRISTYSSDYGMQFNQFLVKDEAPFLFHTGMRAQFADTRDALASLMEPSSLRFIGFSHFESDECGALNEWLAIAPRAQAVCSFVGAMVNVNDFACRPAMALADNEVLDLGDKRLVFLSTPHVPHGWDAGLFFEEKARTLFSSDLFFQPGNPEPMATSGVIEQAREAIRLGLDGPFANDVPYTHHTEHTLARLAGLEPQTVAVMHGSSFSGDGRRALNELSQVLRELLGPAASIRDAI